MLNRYTGLKLVSRVRIPASPPDFLVHSVVWPFHRASGRRAARAATRHESLPHRQTSSFSFGRLAVPQGFRPAGGSRRHSARILASPPDFLILIRSSGRSTGLQAGGRLAPPLGTNPCLTAKLPHSHSVVWPFDRASGRRAARAATRHESLPHRHSTHPRPTHKARGFAHGGRPPPPRQGSCPERTT